MSNTLSPLGLAGAAVPTATVFDPGTSPGQGFSTAVTVANGKSGTDTVASTFVAAGPSATFAPIAGRSFNVSVIFSAIGLVQLQRSFDAGASWNTTDTLFTSDSSSYTEPEFGVIYRLNCVSVSGNIAYRMSQ